MPPAGGSVPWRPPMAERAGGHLFPSHSSAPEESHTPANPPHFPGLPRNCSPQGRCAQMWQEPAVPPQTPVTFGHRPASPGRLRAGIPLRSNVVGTYGSPTNAPSQNAVQGFVVDSVCAAAFFHRGIIPLLTLFFSASGSQKTAVTPLEEGRQMPSGLPPPCGGISSLATPDG